MLPLLEPCVNALTFSPRRRQHEIELVCIDSVGSLNLAGTPRRGSLDVDVLDAVVERVPVEPGAVVGLDHLQAEGQLLEHVGDELEGGRLIEAVEDAEYLSSVRSSMAVNW